MRLTLIRHADSIHSQQQTIADIAGCRGLTQHGFAQAKRLAKRLQIMGELNDCQTMLYSPVLRAQQTAQVLLETFPVQVVKEDHTLRELHPGVADGLSWQEYRQKFGAFDLINSPNRPFAPQGETWLEFIRRVRDALEQIANEYKNQNVIAVTHAGFIVASFLILFDIPRPGTGAHIDPLHTSLTEWRKSDGAWQLVKYNDYWHLDATLTRTRQT